METLLNRLEAANYRNTPVAVIVSHEELETLISLLKGGWVKCEDRLPDSCRNVLCYYKPYGFFEARRYNMSVTYFVTTENNHDGEGDYFASATVTHWRELPTPPTE